MTARSYQFTHAIVRQPGSSLVEGLRAVDTGTPDLALFKEHHASYIAALESTGAKVITTAPSEEFPDSVFVEDCALCLNEFAILMRPGAPSRFGEAALMRPVLQEIYDQVITLGESGHVEGGDILTLEHEVLVGLSARTDKEGVEALRQSLSYWGYKLRVVETPADILHFKTDCSLLDEETVLCTPKLAATGCFDGYKIVPTASGEEASANAIRFNDLVIMADGFPYTRDSLRAAGYNVRTIGNTEAAKLDGGMSCLSLRFSPPDQK